MGVIHVSIVNLCYHKNPLIVVKSAIEWRLLGALRSGHILFVGADILVKTGL